MPRTMNLPSGGKLSRDLPPHPHQNDPPPLPVWQTPSGYRDFWEDGPVAQVRAEVVALERHVREKRLVPGETNRTK